MCLLESLDCDIPADFKKMFDMRLHSINNDLLPNVIELYKQLGVQYEPLKIIKPQFEIPLPPLQLAVSVIQDCQRNYFMSMLGKLYFMLNQQRF